MDISAQIAVIATFAALASALGTMLTLARLRRAEQANLFLEMTDRYNQPEMQEALSELANWYNAHPNTFVNDWAADLAQGKPEAKIMDGHRRKVNRYFVNISQLYSAGYIDKNLASLVSDLMGINIYYKIVVPMSYARFDGQKDVYPDILRSIRTHHGQGRIVS